MYLGEALAILGLDGDDGLTQNHVKRTYLRKLKDHPPERDPDGFQRLREAYELVREYADGERAEPAFVAPAPAPAPFIPIQPLWDPAPMKVEEPEPEPEPPVIEPPPPPIATQPPATMIVEEAPDLLLEDRMATVLNLLQHDEHDAANELAAAWREADDHRNSKDGLVKWALTRELLGAATVLPKPVVRLLAQGIADGDMTGPKQALVQFHAQRPFEAEEAHIVLAKRAPSLHGMIGNALARKQPVFQHTYAPPVQRSSSGGGGRIAWIGAVLALGIVRLIAAGSHSSSYDYTPPPRIEIDPRLYQPMPDFQMPVHVQVPAPPPEFQPDADLELQRAEIYESIAALRTFGNAADLQVDAELLERALDRDDCETMRAHTMTIAGLPASDDPERARSVALHFAAIRERLDKICPPAKPKHKKKRTR